MTYKDTKTIALRSNIAITLSVAKKQLKLGYLGTNSANSSVILANSSSNFYKTHKLNQPNATFWAAQGDLQD
jgi:hypothetical protein